MSQSPDSTEQNISSETAKKSSWLWVIIFRLFILGLSATTAIVIGFVFATVYPKENPAKPLTIKFWEQWQGKKVENTTNGNSLPTLENQNQSTNRQIQDQIEQLETQFQQLAQQTSQLESQLGIEVTNQELESRLRTIGQQLHQEPGGLATPVADISVSSLPAQKLKITLPSDLLFAKKSSGLSANAKSILQSIVADLRQYEGATIMIAAHTDVSETVLKDQQLSFHRAKAVEGYLAEALGDRYRWLVIGYGQTRPLTTNTNDAQRQLNRRIEIAVN